MATTCEFDVTIGHVEPMKYLEENSGSYRAKRAKTRERIVKTFLADNVVDIKGGVTSDEAFIAVQRCIKEQHAHTYSKKRARRAHSDFRRYAVYIVNLMQRITDHLLENGGVIWGKNLDTLYVDIAVALREPIDDVITAINIAVDQQLLHRQEASDELSVEWVSVMAAA